VLPLASRQSVRKASSTRASTSTMALPMARTSRVAGAMTSPCWIGFRRESLLALPERDNPCLAGLAPLFEARRSRGGSRPMLDAVLRSLRDVLSRDFRDILWKALGLTLLLFLGIFVGVETLL